MSPIPQSVLDTGYRGALHVENWNPATRFHHVKTVAGRHTIRTSRGVVYTTANRLLYTRRNLPRG